MAKEKLKMELPKITPDDIFSTQEDREKIATVRNIDIENIVDFPDHPFKVKNDESLNKMVESINDMGVLNPIIVRPIENGQYQMISGHRRKFASKLANKTSIPAIIKELTDDEAIILMVDSNIQREELLPSEKAFAYKMKLEAIKHQGERSDLTLSPLATKLENKNSAQIIADENGENRDNIYRYIRLTYLIPELLEKVDNKIIAFRPAVELSYLSKNNQTDLIDIIDYTGATPSLSQAIKMKKLEQEGKLDTDQIDDILSAQKPNQAEKMSFNRERIQEVLPKNIDDKKAEKIIIEALQFYWKHKQKSREDESR